jgi:hypothetical protein
LLDFLKSNQLATQNAMFPKMNNAMYIIFTFAGVFPQTVSNSFRSIKTKLPRNF